MGEHGTWAAYPRRGCSLPRGALSNRARLAPNSRHRRSVIKRRLPGVGNVNISGAGQYSMRVWLDPDKLKARSLNAQDVVATLQQQSQQVTAGQVGTPPTPPGVNFQYTIDLQGRLTDVEQFANVIVKTGSAGEITRLHDVGRVELGAQTYSQIFTLDGQPAAGIGIYQTPGANALDVEREVKVKMEMPMVIPAWHPMLERVYIYKTAHHPRLETDYKQFALDAAMATAAAPTFLKPHLTSDSVELVDGGVWANNPIGVVAIEAVGMLNWPGDSAPARSRRPSPGACHRARRAARARTGRGGEFYRVRPL